MSLRPHIPLILASAIFLTTLALVVRLGVALLGGMAILAGNSSVGTPSPQARRQTPDPTTTLRLGVEANGTILLGNQPVPDASLGQLVRERAPKEIIIQAAPAASYTRIKALLQELSALGVKHIVFSVSDPSKTPHPSAATTPPR